MASPSKFAVVEFNAVLPRSVDVGSEDEHQVCTVDLDVAFEGQSEHWAVLVKQTVGTRREEAALEISFPPKAKIRLDQAVLRSEVERYYRAQMQFAQAAGSIKIIGGMVRGPVHSVTIPVLDGQGGW